MISKTTLIKEIAEETKTPQATVKSVVDSFWKHVAAHVEKDERVTFIGYGAFYKKHTDARTGRNPKTGESLQIAESNKLAFKSALKFD